MDAAEVNRWMREVLTPFRGAVNIDRLFFLNYLQHLMAFDHRPFPTEDQIRRFFEDQLNEGLMIRHEEFSNYVRLGQLWELGNQHRPEKPREFEKIGIWAAFAEVYKEMCISLRAQFHSNIAVKQSFALRVFLLELENIQAALVPSSWIGPKTFIYFLTTLNDGLSMLARPQDRYHIYLRILSWRNELVNFELPMSKAGWPAVLYGAAEACIDTNRHGEALTLLEEWRLILGIEEEQLAKGDLLFAVCYNVMLRFDDCRRVLLSALASFEKLDHDDGIFNASHQLAVLHDFLGDWVVATSYRKKAWRMCLRMKLGPITKARILMEWGTSLVLQRKMNAAIQKYEQALRLFEGVPAFQRDRTIAKMSIAMAKVDLNDRETAWEMMEAAAREIAFMELGNDFDRAHLYHNMGTIAMKSGRFEMAKEYLLHAIALNSETMHVVDVSFNLGKVEIECKNFEGAERYLWTAIEGYGERADTRESWEGALLEWVFVVHFALPTSAVEIKLLTIRSSKLYGHSPALIETLLVIYFIESQQYAKAISNFERVIAVIDASSRHRTLSWAKIVSYQFHRRRIAPHLVNDLAIKLGQTKAVIFQNARRSHRKYKLFSLKSQ